MRRVCPTGRRDTFSPRTWDQGSLCPGFRPKVIRYCCRLFGYRRCVNFQSREIIYFRSSEITNVKMTMNHVKHSITVMLDLMRKHRWEFNDKYYDGFDVILILENEQV